MNESVNTLSFPGLGIGEFEVHKVAFTLFGRPVAWYGILITIGIILAFLYSYYRFRQEKLSADDLLDYAIWCLIIAIVGARTYYVATSWSDFYVPGDFWKTLYNSVAIWEGGLAIYGAVIAGGITVYVVSKIKRIKATQAFDAIGLSVMIGQIIGRWGNFMNAEAHGGETTLPWRMGIKTDVGTVYYHPTFLYESIWNLIGFLIINSLYKKKKYDGQIFLMYVTWYGFGRMFIEGLRTDSLIVGSFRISQVVAFVSFLAGATLLIVFGILGKKNGWKPKAIGTPADASPAAEAPESGGTAKAEEIKPEKSSDGNEDQHGTED